MYLSNLGKEWFWEREKASFHLIKNTKTNKIIENFCMVFNYCVAFMQQLYKTEVHRGTLMERSLHTQPGRVVFEKY